VTMKWDKYWSSNKKYLEPRACRYMAIAEDGAVTLKLLNMPDGVTSISVQVHPKDASLGACLGASLSVRVSVRVSRCVSLGACLSVRVS
jgi:hypothetical protein